MIFDAYGKSVGGPRLLTPSWMVADMRRISEQRAADARVRDLRWSFSGYTTQIGATITVKLPKRYVVSE